MAKAAKLKCITQLCFRGARFTDGGEVILIKAVVAHHIFLGRRKGEQGVALLSGHRDACWHENSFINALPFDYVLKENIERRNAAFAGWSHMGNTNDRL